MTTWTRIPKPLVSVPLSTGGTPIGLLLALTYADSSMTPGVQWTRITKATGTTWTRIAKAT